MTADEIRQRREELDRQLYAPADRDCTAVYQEYLRLGEELVRLESEKAS